MSHAPRRRQIIEVNHHALAGSVRNAIEKADRQLRERHAEAERETRARAAEAITYALETAPADASIASLAGRIVEQLLGSGMLRMREA